MSLSEAVVLVAVANLHPDPDNTKTHSEANLGHIRASIEQFGFNDPIGVVEHPDPVVGGYMIVEGHGRHLAAVGLGLAEVPCIVLTLDEAARRGYGIAHNQIQMITGMDMSAVAGEFGRLGVSDDDFNALGFSDEDVLFMPQVSTPLGDKFSAPDGGEYIEQQAERAGTADDAKSFGGFLAPTHKSVLRFASETSFNRFIHMQQSLRARYPVAASIGERLQILIADLAQKRGTTHADV